MEFSLQTRLVLNFSILLADPGRCFRKAQGEGGEKKRRGIIFKGSHNIGIKCLKGNVTMTA